MRDAKQPPSASSVLEMATDAQAAVWAEVATKVRRGFRALLGGLLGEDPTAHVGAARRARVPARRGLRNGHCATDDPRRLAQAAAKNSLDPGPEARVGSAPTVA